MKNRDYTAAADFLVQMFGEWTEGAVEVRCCPNDGVDLPPRSLFSRDIEDITLHLQRHDVDGMGCYVGMCTRIMGKASGKRDNLHELRTLWSDVDLKRLASGWAIERLIEMAHGLPMPPSIITFTGGGLHFYWLLVEPLDVRVELNGATALENQIVDSLKRLAGVVGGDPRVCDLARILRLPGTVNSKPEVIDGECRVLEADWDRRYELGDLEEWLDWQRPMVDLAEPEQRPLVHKPSTLDPFAAYAKDLGIRLPKDIDGLLAAMTYGGGDQGIHAVQLQVSASLAKKGVPVDDIVQMLLDATRAAAGLDGDRWNWAREEANIRRMTEDALLKYGVTERLVPDNREPPQASPRSAPSGGGAAPATVIDMAAHKERKEQEQAKAKAKAAKVDEDASTTEKIAELVMKAWETEHGPMIVTGEGLWTYRDGIWNRPSPDLDLVLKVKIQGAIVAMGKDPSTSRKGAVLKFIMEHPRLHRSELAWDDHELVVLRNTALEPLTGTTLPLSPDLYATSRIEADYQPMARCPLWLNFLKDTFGYRRPAAVRDAIISLLQEWFGLLLWKGAKTRDMKLALILFGPSRTGKTVVSTVARGLVAGKAAGVVAKLLEQHFGPAALLGMSAWIADDVVGRGDYVDAEWFKAVVTGEERSVPRKGLPNVEARFGIPVLWTANHLPRVKDDSQAVFNRAILVPMTKVRSVEEVGKVDFGEHEGMGEMIAAVEMPGVVNWALEGLRRILKRRYFDIPAELLEARKEFEEENNPVVSWLKECVEEAPSHVMVDRRDIVASYEGWFVEAFGKQSRPMTPRALHPAIQRQMPETEMHKIMGQRYTRGLRLTEEGVAMRNLCVKNSMDDRGSGRENHEINIGEKPVHGPRFVDGDVPE